MTASNAASQKRGAGMTKREAGMKVELFLFVGLLLFVGSLLSIKIASAGNRTLVLLPFLVLIAALGYKASAGKIVRKILPVSLVLIAVTQLYMTYAWTYIKLVKSPQEVSSAWIQKHVPPGQTIGIENIPIYHGIPDITQKEFYFKQYDVAQRNLYGYEVIDSTSRKLPSLIIITSDEINERVLKKSDQKDLVHRLKKEGYKKVIVFRPDFRYFALFGTELDYYVGSIVAAPLTTSIYRK